MTQPTVMLCTLALNEMEWLPHLYQQHKDWLGLTQWVFIEACDRQYARVNPEMVTASGLSTDGTSQYLNELSHKHPNVAYLPHGFSESSDPSLGKVEAKQRFLNFANNLEPDYVILLDADEFVTKDDQGKMVDVMQSCHPAWTAFVFRKREVWRPPSCVDQPLCQNEVVGGFWNIPCSHWWRWTPGMKFDGCHNTPKKANGVSYNDRLIRWDRLEQLPQPCMWHMGYSSSEKSRAAKHRYYEVRGEAVDPQRKWYTESRAAWHTWKPGDRLPRGARVVPITDEIPEVFR